MKPLRVTSIIPSRTAGGIGPVCFFGADALARLTDWEVTLLSLHDPPTEETSGSGLRLVSLGLEREIPSRFLHWLRANPQDLVISSGVSHIEPAFPYLPEATRHLVQIHDCLRRYHQVAINNATKIDGVVCVAHHIESLLRQPLASTGFTGLLRTIHNGARFPPLESRNRHDGPLRLLFLGRTDAFKGVFDLPPLLKELRRIGVPATLSIVGPIDAYLMAQFAKAGVADQVVWKGVLPHEECFLQAAACELLLMPSRKEPFGMVTIEAMSMGCVPMGYDVVSGTTEIVRQGRTGILVPLGNLREWARQIRILDQDRARLEELSRNAIDDSRRRFDADRMGGELGILIEEVMRRERATLERRAPETFLEALPESPSKARGYQVVPPGIRASIRREIGKRPWLCNWILNRL